MSHPERALQANSSGQTQLPGLDLLRCGAAMLVMLYHYFGCVTVWVPSRELDSYSLGLMPYTWFGWVGVQIFFVISGFVIAYSASHTTAARFARSRFLRLYPTLWICASLTLAVALLSHADSKRLLLHEWVHSVVTDPRQAPFIDPSYWTLPIEISFYLVVFLLLWRQAFRFLGPVVASLGLLSTLYNLYRFGLTMRWSGHIAIADAGVQWIGRLSSPWTLVRFGVYFALGTQLWLFLFERNTAWRAALLSVFVLSGAIGIYNYGLDNVGMLHAGAMTDRLSQVPSIVLWLISVTAIVASVVFNNAISEAIGRRGLTVVRNFGLATYPIYLLHQVIGHIVIRRLHGHLPDGLSALALMTLIPVLCVTVLPHFESPLHERLRRWLGSPAKANKVAPVVVT